MTEGGVELVNVKKVETNHEDDTSAKLDIEDVGPNPVTGVCASLVEKLELWLEKNYLRNQGYLCVSFKVIVFLVYMTYFSYCMYFRFGDEGSIILLVGTLLYLCIKCKRVLSLKGYNCSIQERWIKIIGPKRGKIIQKFNRYGLYLVSFAGLAVYFGLDILTEDPRNSQSLLGIATFIVICFLVSTKPSRVNWHPVYWGFVLQFVFAIFTLRTQTGYAIFKRLGDVVTQLVSFSDAGGTFVLGSNYKAMGLGFSVAAVVIFFNSIIFLLIHWGVLEAVVVNFGFVISYCLNTGPVESVIAVANIFIGSSEAPLLIKTYLPTLSLSELCAVMTCGFASISGGALAFFISLGAPPNHLLTAAVISAPAALAFSKLICPETQRVNVDAQKDIQITDNSGAKRNALSAAADGAVSGVKIVAASMSNMLAFVCIIKLIDAILDWFGQRAGLSGVSFTTICSYLLYPLAYVMGSDPQDCGKLAALIGVKLFATPIVGYTELGKIIKNRHVWEAYVSKRNTSAWHWSGDDVILDNVNVTLVNGFMSERSEVIATYAMCGYSAVTAIGITLGTLVAMCPPRKNDVIKMVMRAFIAGNVASFATGAVAGLLYRDRS
ncbi:solute carrier family 28 member 3-like [Biomphalaria glabrata]|uniref:Solute carrier family 28 member 3-like n=1 Tax=Biomphalaria glabrata TaxID=6526 RepID=A0A9W2ZGZ4_BIOGL|nr:solute carrier family 28 member 3-like [Biomphalaria glabrata]